VQWSGTDVGSGVHYYTIYVSDNGGDYTVWQVYDTATSGTYDGQAGHTYAFICQATDNVGNVEAMHTTADTTTTVVAGVAVSGVVDLEGWEGSPQTVSLSFAPASGAAYTESATLDSNGSFSLTDVTPGQYTVHIKAPMWLQKDVAIDTSKGAPANVNVTLLSGDVNGDNMVNINDFEELVTAYGSSSSSSNWDPNADLNGDGVVDINDFVLLAVNYGDSGDP
jgi:hypothetical protein